MAINSCIFEIILNSLFVSLSSFHLRLSSNSDLSDVVFPHSTCFQVYASLSQSCL